MTISKPELLRLFQQVWSYAEHTVRQDNPELAAEVNWMLYGKD